VSLFALILGLGLADPTFSGPPTRDSNNGSLLLEWDRDPTWVTYEVEQSGGDEPVRTVYSGRLPSAHVSGLLPGNYAFRLRGQDESGAWSDWSPHVELRVEYQPMGAVLASLGLGAIVFLLTAGFVASRAGQEEAET
jgi:hypothetical protein